MAILEPAIDSDAIDVETTDVHLKVVLADGRRRPLNGFRA
jgi:hypothetical protein